MSRDMKEGRKGAMQISEGRMSQASLKSSKRTGVSGAEKVRQREDRRSEMQG